MFKKYSYDPQKLPELNMTVFDGSDDYIHYIQPNHMTSPVMCFTDAWGRAGIAIHIRGKGTSTREWRVDDTKTGKVSDINSVWIFHEREIKRQDLWVGSVSQSIKAAIDERHNETDHVGELFRACPHCPITGTGLMSASLLKNILAGKDPDFQLGKRLAFS